MPVTPAQAGIQTQGRMALTYEMVLRALDTGFTPA